VLQPADTQGPPVSSSLAFRSLPGGRCARAADAPTGGRWTGFRIVERTASQPVRGGSWAPLSSAFALQGIVAAATMHGRCSGIGGWAGSGTVCEHGTMAGGMIQGRR
jgi:hypothetical protein